MKAITVPTGKIIVFTDLDGREIECLSLGDYGQAHNIKADFLGLTKEIHGVPNGPVMPLEKKWVMTLSTQAGCSMGCKFCDVPQVGPGYNLSTRSLVQQFYAAREAYPEVETTERLNVHFARMGEPTFNHGNVLEFASLQLPRLVKQYLPGSLVHPVISTMMPRKNQYLYKFLLAWCQMKNNQYAGHASLQISINSTSDEQREEMFSGSSLSLEAISSICEFLPPPVRRKYALNFALADEYEVDGDKLAYWFNPDHFMVKITPIHVTAASTKNGIETSSGYSAYHAYKDAEESLKKAGFDVLVFVPSQDEDDGMITCGNAVLSGKMPSNRLSVMTNPAR